jgi:hypothetical protein
MENTSTAVNAPLQLRWPVFSRPSLAGFERPPRLDIVISLHHAVGVQRLLLTGQQAAPTLTQEVQTRILDWLDNLSDQPIAENRRLRATAGTMVSQ